MVMCLQTVNYFYSDGIGGTGFIANIDYDDDNNDGDNDDNDDDDDDDDDEIPTIVTDISLIRNERDAEQCKVTFFHNQDTPIRLKKLLKNKNPFKSGLEDIKVVTVCVVTCLVYCWS